MDAAGLELWQTPRTRYWIPPASRNALPFDLARQESQLYGKAGVGPGAGDIVLDCGAKFGVTVSEALAAGAEKVVAIEPTPENMECLRRNLSNEIAIGRVVLYPSTTIDKLVADLGLPRVDYIKFDLDGAEANALRDAHHTIVRFKPRISIVTSRKSNPGLISKTIHGIRPDYQVRCGPCEQVMESYSIRPNVLYFK